MQIIQFRHEGIYCVPGKFYIDPWKPVERALITHGHGDHAHRGMKKYLCHHFSVPILQSRLGPDITVEGIGFNETIVINGVRVSFHPAGHVVGSAQIRMEYKGKVVVVSGDYKLQDDGLSTPFEPIRCHEFVSESTFGLPIYQWNDIDKQEEELRQWIAHNQSYGRTSVFVGYSLGKAQRILKAVADVAPTYVHHSIHRINQAYESIGIELPKYEVLDFREDIKYVDQGIVVLPPAMIESKVIKKIPNMSYAICSGWMTVRGARRWRSADAGFALSDHADWNDLLKAIRSTEAEKIYITHGQTTIFSKYLCELGYEAEEVMTAYGEEESNAIELEGNV